MENEVKTTTEKQSPITKKDVVHACRTWQIIADASSSYERKQGISVCTAMSGILKKLYKDNPEGLTRALKRHLNFFNTEGNWGGIVLGATIAMEESMVDMPEDDKDDIINGFKVGLMGPLAGIGDSIDWGTLKPIILGIGVSMAMTGNIFGFVVCLLFDLLILCEGWFCWWMGYTKGKSALGEVMHTGIINKLIGMSSLIGMFMMGSLSASYVSLSTPLEIATMDSAISIQGLLDSILPGLLPICVVLAIYFILRNKTQKFGWIALGVVGVSLVGALLGIF